MKYIIGFIIGVVITSLYFMWQNRVMSASLKENVETMKEATPGTSTSSNDFEAFYQRFHEDSLYQIAHITFPLEGLPPQADSLTFVNGYRWQKKDWRMQKEINTTDGEFTKELSKLGENMFIEQITHKTGQFGIQRRFAKIGEEWQLIYYSALNRIAAQ